MSRPDSCDNTLSPLDLLEMRGLPRDINLLSSGRIGFDSGREAGFEVLEAGADCTTDADEMFEAIDDDFFGQRASHKSSRSLRDIRTLRQQGSIA